MSAFLLSNVAEFRDQWHDCAATSARLAEILGGNGLSTFTSETPEELPVNTALHSLVVVNVGTSRAETSVITDRLGAFVASGGAVLATHSSAVGLGHSPAWIELIGGAWEQETSWHPAEGLGQVNVGAFSGQAHSAVPRSGFTVFDELYTDLVADDRPRPVAWHLLDEERHTLAWLLDAEPGHGRTAYSALGHSTRSYESSGHRRLIIDLASWLLEERR